jgi:hypothetical protein
MASCDFVLKRGNHASKKIKTKAGHSGSFTFAASIYLSYCFSSQNLCAFLCVFSVAALTSNF